jgi:histidinol-phosphate aminotransferase
MQRLLKWINADIAGLKPYEPGRPIEEVAREFGLAPEDVVKLASNENPLGTSPQALRAMRRSLKQSFLYPDGGAYYLRRKLAAHYDVGPDQIILGAGSNEILEFLGHCFLGPQRSIVVSAHAFVIYKLIARMFGARVIEVPTAGLGHDLDAMADAIAADTRIIFVCNPNNPTGTMVGKTAVSRLMRRVPADVLVVFDEAYAEICLGRMPDTLSFVRDNRACVVLRTFSKAYGLAGLRVGYGIAPAALVSNLQRARQPFNVSRLAQDAALAAIDDTAFVKRSRRLFREARDFFAGELAQSGLAYEPTYANFVLVEVGKGAETAAALMRRGVIVRAMAGYGLPRHIRISFGTMPENRKVMSELRTVLDL